MSEPIDVETSPQRGLSTVIDIIVVVISQPHPQLPSGCGLRRAVARRNSGAMPSRWRRRTAFRRFGVERDGIRGESWGNFSFLPFEIRKK